MEGCKNRIGQGWRRKGHEKDTRKEGRREGEGREETCLLSNYESVKLIKTNFTIDLENSFKTASGEREV